jgi:steroid delta-isomerase-like uncharacterized protein
MTDNRASTAEGWEAWFAGDIEGVLRDYADDAEVILPGMPPLRGIEAIRQGWTQLKSAIPEERALRIRHIADGDTVVTEWHTEGVNSGPMPMPDGSTMPATGKTITQSGVTISDYENGKLKRQTFYWDNVDFMQQLGLMAEQ